MPKGKGYNSPVGVGSYKSNPMAQPKRVPSQFGPSSNPDTVKANKLLQQAHAKNENLRGKSGM